MKVIVIRWCLLLLLLTAACSAPVTVVPAPSPILPTTVTTTVGEDSVEPTTQAEPTEAVTPTEGDGIAVEPTIPVTVPASPPPQLLTVYTDESGPGLEFLERTTQDWSATSGWTVAIIAKQTDALRLDFEMSALADQPPSLLISSNEVIAPACSKWFASAR